jgi:hypothetical protein
MMESCRLGRTGLSGNPVHDTGKHLLGPNIFGPENSRDSRDSKRAPAGDGLWLAAPGSAGWVFTADRR